MMETKPCPECGEPAHEVINSDNNTRTGWMCDYCKHFDPAVSWRERKVEVEQNGR